MGTIALVYSVEFGKKNERVEGIFHIEKMQIEAAEKKLVGSKDTIRQCYKIFELSEGDAIVAFAVDKGFMWLNDSIQHFLHGSSDLAVEYHRMYVKEV